MVRVAVWLLLLLVVLILRQSAAVSDQCSEVQEEIARVRKMNHRNKILVDQCYEQLKSETHVSEAAFRSMKLAEDEFKSNREQLEADINRLKKEIVEQNIKRQQSEADINRLKKELVEQNIKRQQSEADINVLKKELDKHKINLQKSGAVNSGLKNELKAKEEVLKTTINDVTNKLKSLNQTVQRLFEEPQHVCRDLLDAAKSGDVNTVKILFKCSNDNCTNDDMYRNTPLTYAATYGHVEVVRVLLEGGANVERADAFRRTALHRAAWYGHLDVCRLLLDWGAKVDPLNKWKDTPLHWAAGEGHLSVVKLLVERGADVSVKNVDGRTASDLALSSGKKDVADWLDSVKRGKGPLTV